MSVFSKGIGVAIGMGDVPAVSIGSVFTGGAVPAVTRVAFSDGTSLTGDAGLTYVAASDLLVINHNAAAAPAIPQAHTVGLQLVGLDATTTRVLIDGFAGAPSFCGRRANGTNAIPTGVVNGSQLVQLQGLGYTSAGAYTTTATASVVLSGAETWSGTNQGTQVIIQTTPITGSVTQAPVMTIKSASVVIASGAPLTISDSTASTSASTGSIMAAGGIAAVKNIISGQNIAKGVASTATAAGTTTLTNASTGVQIFTGATTQTIQLPAANLFGAGICVAFAAINRSSGIVSWARAGSDTINGGTTNVDVATLTTGTIVSDGVSAWYTV